VALASSKHDLQYQHIEKHFGETGILIIVSTIWLSQKEFRKRHRTVAYTQTKPLSLHFWATLSYLKLI